MCLHLSSHPAEPAEPPCYARASHTGVAHAGPHPVLERTNEAAASPRDAFSHCSSFLCTQHQLTDATELSRSPSLSIHTGVSPLQRQSTPCNTSWVLPAAADSWSLYLTHTAPRRVHAFSLPQGHFDSTARAEPCLSQSHLLPIAMNASTAAGTRACMHISLLPQDSKQ